MGIGVLVGVSVGVADGSAVSVGVKATVGTTTRPPTFRAAYTTPAPISKTTAIRPNAAGKPSVISGMRLACTAFSTFLAAFCCSTAFPVSSVPQTRQRVALSLKRVPQVGQTWVFCEDVSEVIRAGIIPLNKGAIPLRTLDDSYIYFLA